MDKHLVYYTNLERQFLFIFAILLMALAVFSSAFIKSESKEIINNMTNKAKTELFKNTPDSKKVNFTVFEDKDGNIQVIRSKESRGNTVR